MSAKPKRTAHIEIRETDVAWEFAAAPAAVSLRPHYLSIVAANGETRYTSESYANKSNARRAARKDSRELGLPVVEVTR